MIFDDRQEAGELLAEELIKYKGKDAVVVALPRGGVPVGYEIAKALQSELVVFPVRKIGAPFNTEYAIGAIAPDGVVVFDKDAIRRYEIQESDIAATVIEEEEELERRRKLYGDYGELKERIVILCDDGLATGLTAMVAVKSIRKKHPKKIIVAVPCSPVETANAVEKLVDELVCLQVMEDFPAVGACYRRFEQIMDNEVLDLLNKVRR